MGKHKKRDNYYVVEIRQNNKLVFSIINRWKVLQYYDKRVIIKVQPKEYCQIINYDKWGYAFNFDKAISYKNFKKKIENKVLEDLIKNGNFVNFRYIVLKKSEYEEFKKLLYSLVEAKDIEVLKGQYKREKKEIKSLERRIDTIDYKIKSYMDTKEEIINKKLKRIQLAEKYKAKYIQKFKEEFNREPTAEELEELEGTES